MNRGCLVGVGIVVLAVLLCIAPAWIVHNRLVGFDEAISESWAQVETVLQRRYDLIPNLVNTVKGYAEHEKGLLEEITRLRSQWGEARTPGAQVQAATGLESAIARLLLVAERYPDLKANANFIALQDELAGTENRISVERRRYNEAVRAYNTAVRRFPANIYAGIAGFEKKDVYFEAKPGAEDAPDVKF